MNVLSLFTGVGGFDLGLERAGHRIVGQCESDPWRRRLLAKRFPGVPVAEDVRDMAREHGRRTSPVSRERPLAERREPQRSICADLICGGFPCQDLSVAGRRRGLAGERSGLFFEFARIADAVLPPGGWCLIENVPGLLSSHGGRDFAVLLASLADIGFCDLAWRVLDSRHFGVPQRRRRVFILARRASGSRARAVLLEPEGGTGDSQASGEAGQGVAGSVTDGALTARTLTGSERWDGETEDFVANPLGAAKRGFRQDLDHDTYIVQTLTSCSHGAGVNAPGRRKEDDVNLVAHALRTAQHGANGIGVAENEVHTLDGTGSEAVAWDGLNHAASTEVPTMGQNTGQATGRAGVIGTASTVRRLTPVECERLQGFPDNWTAIDGEPVYEKRGQSWRCVEGTPDGPRYAACGDAVTVPVAEWIGHRLASKEKGEARS